MPLTPTKDLKFHRYSPRPIEKPSDAETVRRQKAQEEAGRQRIEDLDRPFWDKVIPETWQEDKSLYDRGILETLEGFEIPGRFLRTLATGEPRTQTGDKWKDLYTDVLTDPFVFGSLARYGSKWAAKGGASLMGKLRGTPAQEGGTLLEGTRWGGPYAEAQATLGDVRGPHFSTPAERAGESGARSFIRASSPEDQAYMLSELSAGRVPSRGLMQALNHYGKSAGRKHTGNVTGFHPQTNWNLLHPDQRDPLLRKVVDMHINDLPHLLGSKQVTYREAMERLGKLADTDFPAFKKFVYEGDEQMARELGFWKKPSQGYVYRSDPSDQPQGYVRRSDPSDPVKPKSPGEEH